MYFSNRVVAWCGQLWLAAMVFLHAAENPVTMQMQARGTAWQVEHWHRVELINYEVKLSERQYAGTHIREERIQSEIMSHEELKLNQKVVKHEETYDSVPQAGRYLKKEAKYYWDEEAFAYLLEDEETRYPPKKRDEIWDEYTSAFSENLTGHYWFRDRKAAELKAGDRWEVDYTAVSIGAQHLPQCDGKLMATYLTNEKIENKDCVKLAFDYDLVNEQSEDPNQLTGKITIKGKGEIWIELSTGLVMKREQKASFQTDFSEQQEAKNEPKVKGKGEVNFEEKWSIQPIPYVPNEGAENDKDDNKNRQ